PRPARCPGWPRSPEWSCRLSSCSSVFPPLVGAVIGQPPARPDQGAQAGVQVELPGIRADLEALGLGVQSDVGEADFGRTVPRGDLEMDLGVRPLGLVPGEVEVAVQDTPGDSLPGDQLSDLDPAAMGVRIPVGELVIGLAGAALDVLGPPATDIVNGAEDFFGGLVH